MGKNIFYVVKYGKGTTVGFKEGICSISKQIYSWSRLDLRANRPGLRIGKRSKTNMQISKRV